MFSILGLALFSATLMAVFSIIATVAKRGEVYDLGWTLTVVFIFLSAYLLLPAKTDFNGLILALVFLWGFKLLGVVLVRLFMLPEDFRYKNVTRHFLAFLFQYISAILFAVPAVFEFVYPGQISWIFWVGFVIAFVSLVLNSLCDIQLTRHRLRGDGTLLTTGFWSISRYPNYLFEVLFWFGVSISQINALNELLALISPVYAWFILSYFSGVPMQEKRRLEKYGGLYKDYAEKVPRIFPTINSLRNLFSKV